MTPHEHLTALDRDGAAYVLARLDVKHGQTLMGFIEYEVLNHTADWLELKACCMKIKTGPRNGWVFSKEDIKANGSDKPVWFRWADLSPFEIRTLEAAQ